MNVAFVAAVDFGALYLFHQVLKVDVSTSVVLGFLAAFVVNYLVSRVWVFRSIDAGKTNATSLPKFALLTLVNLITQSVGVTALVLGGLNYLVAKGILVGIMFFVNYLISKKYIF